MDVITKEKGKKGLIIKTFGRCEIHCESLRRGQTSSWSLGPLRALAVKSGLWLSIGSFFVFSNYVAVWHHAMSAPDCTERLNLAILFFKNLILFPPPVSSFLHSLCVLLHSSISLPYSVAHYLLLPIIVSLSFHFVSLSWLLSLSCMSPSKVFLYQIPSLNLSFSIISFAPSGFGCFKFFVYFSSCY